MQASFLSVLLIVVVLSAGASLAQAGDEGPSLNESDPFLEEDELFENASDPFAAYEDAARDAENVTLVDPSPLPEDSEEQEDDPPTADPEAEEDRSTPGPGLWATLAGVSLALIVGSRR